MIRHSLPGLAVLALIATTTAGLADGLTARISTDKLALGDTFQLTLSADPAKLTEPPDVSALNADFNILGTSKSSQTRIVNGVRTGRVEWTITLAPRAKGHLTIPPLSAGQATSEALSVDVVDAADLSTGQGAPGGTKITASVEPGAHYVQQEIPLTLRIVTGAGFRGGAIAAPESPGYVLEQRGEDRPSQMTSNGLPVTVIERDYLLRPQKSGTLIIAPFTLRASEDDPSAKSPFAQSPFDSFFGQSPFGGAGSPFDQMFSPGREIAVRTAPLTLEVKPKPAASAGWFLPAKAVTLKAEWDPANPKFRVGEAVTRHVRIRALGATGVQLPDLAPPQVDGARVYLEKSDAGSIDTPAGIGAVRDFTYSLVPTTGGEITLPEVSVDWFDTIAEMPRVATLPAETITVEGPVAAAPAQPVAPVEAATAPMQVGRQSDNTATAWIAALVAAFAAALAGAGYFWRRHSTGGHTPKQTIDPTKASSAAQRKAAIRQVEAACAASDPKAAYVAALSWLHACAPDTGMEDGLIWRRFPDLRASWHDLEARMFSGHEGDWDAREFLRRVKAADKGAEKGIRGQARTALPPLYGARGDRLGNRDMIATACDRIGASAGETFQRSKERASNTLR